MNIHSIEGRASDAGIVLDNLKGKTIRGGFLAICSQPVKFLFRTVSLVLLARILVPEEFGLVGMVTAVTGVIGMFKDAGLSAITVQRPVITDEQVSTLFWINMAVGAILVGLSISLAPVLVSFYREPRLFWVTVALGSGFIFNAAATQHQALLRRHMRYAELVGIDVISLLVSVAVGIAMAVGGFGYWSLVGMQVVLPVANAVFVWVAFPWIPGLPRRNIGIRSMLNFGGTVTLNSLVIYLAYSADKILLGRYWGPAALGTYGRSFQLFNMPIDQLNGANDWVAFPVLSRLQGDPDRFRKYFLKGYSLVLALTIPFVIGCAVFAEEMIIVLLGPKWKDAAAILRLLTPTGLAFALINPFGPLLMARGQVGRSLKMALVIAPVLITGYVAGLRYGPEGVALGSSAGMTLLIVPMIAWAKHGTSISTRDIFRSLRQPFLSGVVAAVATLLFKYYFGPTWSPYASLLVGGSVLIVSYLWLLLYIMGQKDMYLDLLREIKKRS
jgi:PST family polysaccharide transporter